MVVSQLWEAQNLHSQAFLPKPQVSGFLSLPCGRAGGGAAGPKPPFSGHFVTPHAGLGGWGRGARAVTERPWFLELWEAQNRHSQAFVSLPCRPGGGGGRTGTDFLSLPCGPGGGARAATERHWLWSLGLRFRVS